MTNSQASNPSRHELGDPFLRRLSIGPYQFNHSKAWQLAWLSAIAYLDPFEAVQHCRHHGAQHAISIVVGNVEALVVLVDDVDVVAFRGTDPASLLDWFRNLSTSPAAGLFGRHDRVHGGFSADVDLVLDQIVAALGTQRDRALMLCGHSSGGARALVAAAKLIGRGIRVAGISTCGAPRVGNGAFCSALEASVSWLVQHQARGDIVTRVPHIGIPWRFWKRLYMPLVYRHAGRIDYLAREGQWITDPTIWRKLIDRIVYGRLSWWSTLAEFLLDHRVAGYEQALRDRLKGSGGSR